MSGLAISFQDREEWREWLEKNHEKSGGIWLAIAKKHTGNAGLTYHEAGAKKQATKMGVTYDEAVEEALAFGWIDGQTKTLDGERYQQRFSPRRRGSTWAKSNKQRVEKLIREGRMAPAGLALVEAARQDGSWDMLTDVDDLVIPSDLKAALSTNPQAVQHFEKYSDSFKRQILWWIASAKQPETRQKRVARVVEAAAQGQRPF